jgi:hypothetical protein
VRAGITVPVRELPIGSWLEVDATDEASRRLIVQARAAGVALFAAGSDIVGVAEIAQRAVIRPDTVHVWRHRHPSFPEPIAELAAGPVWSWSDVAMWLARPRPPGRKRAK